MQNNTSASALPGAKPEKARHARYSSFADLGNVGLLEGEPVLRPAEDVVDLADVEVHLEELALHQAVP